MFFFFTHHHRSRARPYSRRGCENNRRDKTTHKPLLTQISLVSTDTGLKRIQQEAQKVRENSTKHRWQERRRHHSEQGWSYLCLHKIYVQTMHPLCYEDAVKVEGCVWAVRSSICRFSTYRKETGHQRHVA